MREFGMLVFRVALSVMFLVVAILLAAITAELASVAYARSSLLYVLAVSFLLPIWYRSPMPFRFRAVAGAAAAGVLMWLVAFWVLGSEVSNPRAAAAALIQVAAPLISAVVAWRVLRKGRFQERADRPPEFGSVKE